MSERVVPPLRKVALAGLVAACLVAVGGLAGAEPGATSITSLALVSEPGGTTPFLYGAYTCTAPGTCDAIGPGALSDDPAAAPQQLTVDAESAGTWGPLQALQWPADAAATGTLWPGVDSIACPTALDCTAVGGYATTSNGAMAPMTVSQTSGTWAQAVAAPVGASAVSGSEEEAQLLRVVCVSAANCVALGVERDVDGLQHLFVDTETAGTWGTATELPQLTLLTSKDQYESASLACADLADCLVVAAASGLQVPSYSWVESAGTWSNPTAIGRSTDGFLATGVACPDAATCIAVGEVLKAPTPVSPAVGFPGYAVQTGGAWGAIQQLALPRLSPLAFEGALTSISCDTDTTCVATGTFLTPPGRPTKSLRPLSLLTPGVVTWSNGSWSTFGYLRLPELQGSLLEVSELGDVSCPSTSSCSALGESVGLSFFSLSAAAYAVDLVPVATPQAPGSPVGPSGGQLRGGLVAKFAPPYHDGGDPVLSFTARVEPGGASCHTTGYSCQIHGLQNGHHYWLLVSDQTAFGPSTATRSMHQVIAGVAPTRPGGVVLSRGPASVKVRWHAAHSVPGEPVLHYDVTLTGPNGSRHTVQTHAGHCAFGGIRKPGRYRVSVVAVDASGASLPSRTATIRVP